MSSSSDSDSDSDPEKRKDRQFLKWQNRKQEIRPRIGEEVFKRKVAENLTNFFKNNPELESVTVLDLGVFHKRKNVMYSDEVYTNDTTLCTILDAVENSNVKHLNLTSDWKIGKSMFVNGKPVDASNFAWRLPKFAEENKILETITMTGVAFDKKTEERLRHFTITNKSQLRVLTDFSDDADIVLKRTRRLAIPSALNIPFVGVFGTKARVHLSGYKVLEEKFDGKLLIILTVRENENFVEYKYAFEGHGGNCCTITTNNGEVTGLTASLGGFYQIKKEGDIFVCEIQSDGGYKSCSVFERMVTLTNFSIEVE